jgi:hypothetical protein
MATSARLIVLALVGVLAGTGMAFAETVTATATKWKLLGTWRIDCSKPTSTDNTNDNYLVKDGRLFLDRDFGSGQDSSPVLAATINADGSLTILIRFKSFAQTRENTFIKDGDDRKRAVSNRNVDTDEYTVRDGKFTDSGNATRWYNRCN